MSTTLTISNKNLDCNLVLYDLHKCGYTNVNIIPGKSIVDNDIEKSCSIVFSKSFGNNKDNINTLWNTMKNNYNLTCCHLNISGEYAGCVLNWLRDSLCK